MIRIFVNQLPFYFIRSTDKNYVKNFRMIQSDLGVTFFYPKDYFWGWKENLYAVINKIFSILRLKCHIKYKYPKEYVGREFDSQKFDLVYSQAYLPKNINHLPVFLETTFWIPGQNYPSSKEKMEEFENKTVPYMKEVLANKCLINLKSECEINNAIKYFPQYKNKFVSLPFLLPELRSLAKEDVVKSLRTPNSRRIFSIRHALLLGMSVEEFEQFKNDSRMKSRQRRNERSGSHKGKNI